MPRYLSSHIIACMTRQALHQLIATLQAAQEITFRRAVGSQMAGRLLCEFEAPDQETLLRFLDEHHVTYEWIIRVELAWETPSTAPTPAQKASEHEQPEAPSAEASAPRVTVQAPAAAPAETLAMTEASPTPDIRGDAGEAQTLHILRSLKDESAWQLITTQRHIQPVAVLLMHDAVLAPPPLDVPMFACETDVLARGLSSPLPLLTYEQIIDLVFACKRVMVW